MLRSVRRQSWGSTTCEPRRRELASCGLSNDPADALAFRAAASNFGYDVNISTGKPSERCESLRACCVGGRGRCADVCVRCGRRA
jgi:hypothetical protein